MSGFWEVLGAWKSLHWVESWEVSIEIGHGVEWARKSVCGTFDVTYVHIICIIYRISLNHHLLLR